VFPAAFDTLEVKFIELKIEEFDLNEMVREIVANVQPMVAENSNRLVVKCRNDLGSSDDQTKFAAGGPESE